MVNIIVAFPKDSNAKSIRNSLIRNGINVTAVCTTGGQVIQRVGDSPDTIIISAFRFRDMLFRELKEYLSPDTEMILLISRQMEEELWGEDIDYLTMPVQMQELLMKIEEAEYRIAERRQQRKRIKIRSKRQLEDIAFAKELLQIHNGLTEAEAHRYLQKRSMDSGLNLAETAKMVIESYREYD